MWCSPTHIILVCGHIYNIFIAYILRILIALISNVPISIAAILIVQIFFAPIFFVPVSIAPILILPILILTILIASMLIVLILIALISIEPRNPTDIDRIIVSIMLMF